MSETTKPQANSAFGIRRSAKYPCRLWPSLRGKRPKGRETEKTSAWNARRSDAGGSLSPALILTFLTPFLRPATQAVSDLLIQCTMGAAANNRLPIISMKIFKIHQRLETLVYRKTILQFSISSHVDSRYKRSLLETMLDRAKRLSSTQEFFSRECKTLKGTFLKLKYP